MTVPWIGVVAHLRSRDYASTDELIARRRLPRRTAGHVHYAHAQRSDNILSAMNETFRISKEAHIAAEIYHLKINHERNWAK